MRPRRQREATPALLAGLLLLGAISLERTAADAAPVRPSTAVAAEAECRTPATIIQQTGLHTPDFSYAVVGSKFVDSRGTTLLTGLGDGKVVKTLLDDGELFLSTWEPAPSTRFHIASYTPGDAGLVTFDPTNLTEDELAHWQPFEFAVASASREAIVSQTADIPSLGDTNHGASLFALDLDTGELSLLDTGAAPVAQWVRTTADGRFVGYRDTAGHRFLLDRTTGTSTNWDDGLRVEPSGATYRTSTASVPDPDGGIGPVSQLTVIIGQLGSATTRSVALTPGWTQLKGISSNGRWAGVRFQSGGTWGLVPLVDTGDAAAGLVVPYLGHGTSEDTPPTDDGRVEIVRELTPTTYPATLARELYDPKLAWFDPTPVHVARGAPGTVRVHAPWLAGGGEFSITPSWQRFGVDVTGAEPVDAEPGWYDVSLSTTAMAWGGGRALRFASATGCTWTVAADAWAHHPDPITIDVTPATAPPPGAPFTLTDLPAPTLPPDVPCVARVSPDALGYPWNEHPLFTADGTVYADARGIRIGDDIVRYEHSEVIGLWPDAAVLVTSRQLTDDDTNDGPDLYRLDLVTRALRRLTLPDQGSDPWPADTSWDVVTAARSPFAMFRTSSALPAFSAAVDSSLVLLQTDGVQDAGGPTGHVALRLVDTPVLPYGWATGMSDDGRFVLVGPAPRTTGQRVLDRTTGLWYRVPSVGAQGGHVRMDAHGLVYWVDVTAPGGPALARFDALADTTTREPFPGVTAALLSGSGVNELVVSPNGRFVVVTRRQTQVWFDRVSGTWYPVAATVDGLLDDGRMVTSNSYATPGVTYVVAGLRDWFHPDVAGAVCRLSTRDHDSDGVVDEVDLCQETRGDAPADAYGCGPGEVDMDGDSINDFSDRCQSTNVTDRPVDARGCGPRERDTDNDSVNDAYDQCPNTPPVLAPPWVDGVGCGPTQRDSDHDGVNDAEDQCGDQPGDPPSGCLITVVEADKVGATRVVAGTVHASLRSTCTTKKGRTTCVRATVKLYGKAKGNTWKVVKSVTVNKNGTFKLTTTSKTYTVFQVRVGNVSSKPLVVV